MQGLGKGEQPLGCGLISVRPENGRSEPRRSDKPSGMHTGSWAGWQGVAVFGVLAATDPKRQQAWGQHPGYKIPSMTAQACSRWPCSVAVMVAMRWDVKDIELQRCWIKRFKKKICLQGERACFPLPCEQEGRSSFSLQATF